MAKAIVRIGYQDYVMDVKDAVAITEAMSTAERYENKYHTKEEGGATHHVWTADADNMITIQVMPADLYRMARLAGKSEE